VHLRSYAQKNPTQEYKREAFELFSMMLEMIKTDVTKFFMLMRLERPEQLTAVEEPEAPANVQYQHADFAGGGDAELEHAADSDSDVAVAEKPQPFVRSGRKVGRNDPCPCGSGKKYKHCHGKLT
jgi:preprotein translocase subunit SecA